MGLNRTCSERAREAWQGDRAISSVSVFSFNAVGAQSTLERLDRPPTALRHHVLDCFRYGRGRKEGGHVLNVLVRDRGSRRAAFALVVVVEVPFVKHRCCKAVMAFV